MNQFLLVSIILLAGAVTGGSYVYFSWVSHRSPGKPYSVADCINGRLPADAKRILVLGDSLTHGTMSHNWLVDLQNQHGDAYAFINMGWNGDLAYNALQKVDDVIACQPDVVGVFIGGNDVFATFGPKWTADFVAKKNLPQEPTAEWYEQNLTQIIERLRTETDAKIALFTLTLYGEDLNSPQNRKMAAYSQIVEETAAKVDLPIIPVHARMRQFVADNQIDYTQSCEPANFPQYRQLIRWSLVRYHFFFQSWDKISSSRGFLTQTDCAHLNSNAANLIGSE
ncbi:MAG: GDSL-type esterase/lipase family protein, partial [Chloroflexota bacterium]